MKKTGAKIRPRLKGSAIGKNTISLQESSGTKESEQRLKVCILGCGKGGSSLLDILKDDPSITVVGVAEKNSAARGIKLARSLSIPVMSDYRDVISDDVDVIINVTGSKDIGDEIKRIKPKKAELIEGLSARLLWQLVEERRKRIREKEKILKEHEALYHLGLVIENIDSINDAGLAILDYATKLTNTPAGSIGLLDEKKEEMVLVACKGFSAHFKKVSRWEIRRGGLTNNILSQNSPLVIRDLREYPNPNRLLLKEGVRTILAVPLTIEGRIIGTLYVNDFKRREFRAEDISLFSILSIYAAMTLERVKTIMDMRHLSITDGLTGLYNHRYLMEQMQKEIQRSLRYHQILSVMMLDIDHFKDYNDRFGHLEGNKVLKGIARFLQRMARNTDIIGRFGGEEFCVIMPAVKRVGAKAFGKRLLREISSNLHINRRVTLSGGVSTFPVDGNTCLALLKKADERLYRAKKKGRNRMCC